MWLWRGSKRNPLIQIKIRQEGGGRVRGTSRAEINKHDSSEKISSFPSSAHIDLRSTCARARSSARRHRFPRGVSQPISRFTERRRKNRKKNMEMGLGVYAKIWVNTARKASRVSSIKTLFSVFSRFFSGQSGASFSQASESQTFFGFLWALLTCKVRFLACWSWIISTV